MMYLDAYIQKMQFKDNGHIVKNPTFRKCLGLTPIKHHPILIENLKLQLSKGQIVSLIGTSGAGKTTLLRILAGLETRFDGEVNFDSNRVTRPSRKIQIVFQDNRLFPWLNSHHNIAFATKKLDRKARAEHTKKLLNGIGLSNRAKAFSKDLSGGEESRVALARAFADPPELLLLDEPFRALDAVIKNDLQEKLLNFLERKKTTVVLVSHSIEDAVLMSDRVIVLSHNPLGIHREFQITNPRPRMRDDAELVKISTQVFSALKETDKAK